MCAHTDWWKIETSPKCQMCEWMCKQWLLSRTHSDWHMHKIWLKITVEFTIINYARLCNNLGNHQNANLFYWFDSRSVAGRARYSKMRQCHCCQARQCWCCLQGKSLLHYFTTRFVHLCTHGIVQCLLLLVSVPLLSAWSNPHKCLCVANQGNPLQFSHDHLFPFFN